MKLRFAPLLAALGLAGTAAARSTVTLSGVLDGGAVMPDRGNGVEKLVPGGNCCGSRLIAPPPTRTPASSVSAPSTS